ncbi:MAG: FAD-dependent oxidoreductase [Acidobacteria bacterium]|nr:FAD-dependent oxidoreductase [Acidobacteriota bacterium]
MTGLTAARVLQSHGLNVAVFDKGRGVGGRLATRWSDNEAGERTYYDHGAQFFTVRDTSFQTQVDDWLARGLVKEWARGFADASGQPQHDGHPRYCAVNGMNSLARDLAKSLPVTTNAQVASVSPFENGWRVTLASGVNHTAASLLLTPPVEQSLALLDAGATKLAEETRASLERISYAPCFAVLVELEAPSRLPEPGALQLRSEPIAWIGDNHRKGISPDAFTVTLHAGPEFTREHWDAPHEVIAQKLLHAASDWLRAPVKRWQVHRWRYSQPVVTHPEACLFTDEPAPLVFAGDAFGAPRVVGAFLSGRSAAQVLLNR